MASPYHHPVTLPRPQQKRHRENSLTGLISAFWEIAGTFCVFQNSHGTQLYCVCGAGEQIFGLFGRN